MLGATKKVAILASVLFLMVLSPRANAQTAQAWNAFAPTFTAKYTVSTFTPDIAISVSRIQAQVIPPLLPLPGCKTEPVVQISGGATVHNLTLTGAANDSGPIALSYAAGVPITLSVSTASQCLSWATGANIVIQYDTSALSGEVTSLKNQNTALSAQVASLQGQVAVLSSQLTTCESGGAAT